MAVSAEPESPNLGQDFSYETSKPLSLGAAALGLRRRQVGPNLASDPLSERSPAPPACPREPPPRVTKAPTGRQSPTCPPTPPMPGTRSRRAHSDAHRKRKPGRGLKPAHPSVHWSAARSPQCADAARRACRTRFRGEVRGGRGVTVVGLGLGCLLRLEFRAHRVLPQLRPRFPTSPAALYSGSRCRLC